MTKEDKEIKFDSDPDKPYSPDIIKEKNYNIDGSDYKSKLDSIADKNGFIKTRLNEDVIIQRISHDLYKNPESALRELYNNELRACLIAREKYKTDPYIKVSLNTIERKLIIQGFNSLGITEDIFIKVLTELGTSSNNDRSTIGKFGMGFASYTKLSDLMILETKCLENQNNYSVLCKNGIGFEKLPKPNLEHSGTKLSLTYDESIDLDDLISMLEKISKYADVKTYFELISDDNISISTDNKTYEDGLTLLEQTNLRKQFEDKIKEYKEDPDQSVISFDYEDQNIELYVLFSQSKNSDYGYRGSDTETYLIKTPIEINTDYISGYDYLVVNLKNEDYFKPTPDRERLTKEAEKKVKEILIQKLKEAFKISSCKTLSDWFDHDHKWFIGSTNSSLIELFDPQTKELNELLNTKCQSKKIGSGYGARFNKSKIKFEIVKNDLDIDRLFYIEKRDQRKFDTLDYYFKGSHNYFITIINPRWFNDENYNQIVDRLKQFGFKSAKEFIKENKIKLSALIKSDPDYDKEDQPKIDQEITLYYSYEDTKNYWRKELKLNTETIFNDQLDGFNKNDIVIVNGFNKYRQLLKDFETDKIFNNYDSDQERFYLTPEKRHTKDLGFKTLTDLDKELSDQIFYTSLGYKTFNKIKKVLNKNNKKVLDIDFIQTNDPMKKRLLKYLNKKLNHYNKENKDNYDMKIYGTKKDLFKIALVLRSIYDKEDKARLDFRRSYDLSDKIKEVNNELNKKIDLTDHELINNDILDKISYDYDRTVEYINTLKEVEKIKHDKLKKLFKLSQTEDNFREILNDILKIKSELIIK